MMDLTNCVVTIAIRKPDVLMNCILANNDIRGEFCVHESRVDNLLECSDAFEPQSTSAMPEGWLADFASTVLDNAGSPETIATCECNSSIHPNSSTPDSCMKAGGEYGCWTEVPDIGPYNLVGYQCQ